MEPGVSRGPGADPASLQISLNNNTLSLSHCGPAITGKNRGSGSDPADLLETRLRRKKTALLSWLLFDVGGQRAISDHNIKGPWVDSWRRKTKQHRNEQKPRRIQALNLFWGPFHAAARRFWEAQVSRCRRRGTLKTSPSRSAVFSGRGDQRSVLTGPSISVAVCDCFCSFLAGHAIS